MASTSVTTWDFRDTLDMRAASALVGEGLQLCSIAGSLCRSRTPGLDS